MNYNSITICYERLKLMNWLEFCAWNYFRFAEDTDSEMQKIQWFLTLRNCWDMFDPDDFCYQVLTR
jgi:hypothetical protein